MIKKIIAYTTKGFIKNLDPTFKDAKNLLDIFRIKTGITFDIYEIDKSEVEYFQNFYENIKEIPAILIWLQEVTNANKYDPDYIFYLGTDLGRQNARTWLSNYYRNPEGTSIPPSTRFTCSNDGKIITIKKGDIGFEQGFDDAETARTACAGSVTNKGSVSPWLLGAAAVGIFLFFRK